LNLNNKIYSWNFTIAKIPHAILGADFLTYYNLLIDCKNGKIIENLHNRNDINSINITKRNYPDSLNSILPKTKITEYYNTKRNYKSNNNTYINTINKYNNIEINSKPSKSETNDHKNKNVREITNTKQNKLTSNQKINKLLSEFLETKKTIHLKKLKY